MKAPHHRTAFVAAAAAAIAVAAGGCAGGGTSAAARTPSGPPPSPIPTASPLPASDTIVGGTVVSRPAAGFSLTLPSGWEEIPNDSATSAAALGTDGERELQTDGKLFAIKAATDGATNLSVIAVPAAGATLRQVVDASIARLREEHATDITTRMVALPAGMSARVTFTISGRTAALEDTQYYVLEAGQAYVLTFATANRAANTRAFDSIMASLRLTK